MSAHTPGPWSVATTPGSAGGIQHANGFIAFTAIPRTVSDARRPGESWLEMRDRTATEREAVQLEEKDNARLIAAAPELLAALQRAIDEAVADDLDEWFANARAAIAKATGAA